MPEDITGDRGPRGTVRNLHIQPAKIDKRPGTIVAVGIGFACIGILERDIPAAVCRGMRIIRHHFPQRCIDYLIGGAGIELDDVDSILEEIGKVWFIAHGGNRSI